MPQVRHQVPNERRKYGDVSSKGAMLLTKLLPGALTASFPVYVATECYPSRLLAAVELPWKLVHRLWSLKIFIFTQFCHLLAVWGGRGRQGSTNLSLKRQTVNILAFGGLSQLYSVLLL